MREEHFRHLDPGQKVVEMPKSIKKLNDILRRELGTLGSYPVVVIPLGTSRRLNGNDTPHYQWYWADNLVRGLWTGEYDAVPAMAGSSILAPRKQYRMLRATTAPRGTWIVVKALGVADEEVWDRTFPMQQHPGRVYLEEVTFSNKLIATKSPTLDLTNGIVEVIKQHRNEDFSLLEESINKAKADKMKAARLAVRTELDPLTPLRWGMPGKRNHPTWQRRASQEKMVIEK